MRRIELALTQPDWARFMSPEGLAEKAGTGRANFPRMILKELADNAADAGGAWLRVLGPDEVMIGDTGPGMAAADLADMFSIKRPLVSTKHWRMGRRGALGNGLRAVMGGLYLLRGCLIVTSRGVESRVRLNHQGDTVVESEGAEFSPGTQISVFCPGISANADFAETAINLVGPVLSGSRPSPFWFDAEAIRDLQRSAEGISVREFVTQFGTSYAPEDKATMASDMHSQVLLDAMRSQARRAQAVKPVGSAAFAGSYARRVTTASIGDVEIPACIEVWATGAQDWDEPARLILNRTRALADASINAGAKGRVSATLGATVWTFCAKDRDRRTLKPSVPVAFTIALSAPFFPIVSSGKAPDFEPFAFDVLDVVVKAGRAAQAGMKRRKTGEMPTIREAVWELLPGAYDRVSDGGQYHANARQLMYEMRPDILRMCGIDKFSDNTITQLYMPEFRDDHPDLTAGWKIAYDARGSLFEPHTGHSVALGTTSVGSYTARTVRFQRAVDSSTTFDAQPEERFAGLLFIEKEGFTELVQSSGILERFDLALASTKGMSTTAARTLIDEMAGRIDGFQVFVAADFDITGQSIRRTLTGDTGRFRFRNRVTAHHVAVTWEQAQRLDREGRSEPVVVDGDLNRKAATLRECGLSDEAIAFLTTDAKRVELNALRPAEFLDTLRAGIQAQAPVKVIPGTETLSRAWIEMDLRRKLLAAEKDLRARPEPTMPPELLNTLRIEMKRDPRRSWDQVLFELAGGETG